MDLTEDIVRLEHITKCFSKVVANRDVSFSIGRGEVLSLLGENGAGKSTVMKILYGLYSADSGDILINGSKVPVKSPFDARKNGIAMVQQHFSLVPVHTAVENIMLGNAKGRIDFAAHAERIRRLAEKYGFAIPLDKPVGSLSVGEQQKAEILKALYINASLLILDEPTAVLTPQEADSLMDFIRSFVADGGSVVFITHKMREVMSVSDRVIVMRNGEVAGERSRGEFDERDLAALMMGEAPDDVKRDEETDFSASREVLSVRDLRLNGKDGTLLDGVSLSVHAGEVFGIAGVSGNGQDSLCDCICGKTRQSGGSVLLDGTSADGLSIEERIRAGIGYVPVDRYRDALVMDMTLAENMLLRHSFDSGWSRRGFVKQSELRRYTSSLIEGHRVKATGPDDIAGGLSGGNQQKMVLAREVDIGSRLLVFNQPTRGLDMGAVDRIHRVILDERKKGKAVLLVSTEISELFEICDTIAVMFRGRIMATFANGKVSANELGLLMAGVRPDGLSIGSTSSGRAEEARG